MIVYQSSETAQSVMVHQACNVSWIYQLGLRFPSIPLSEDAPKDLHKLQR